MKTYTFLNLSNLAQIKACYDYSLGWKETHPNEDLSFYEIYDLLLQNTEETYLKNGTLTEE